MTAASDTRAIFEIVKQNLNGRIEEVLAGLLPGGRVMGGEYVCGSVSGGTGDSCRTNLRTGVGSDFATGEKWRDVIALAAVVRNCGQKSAALHLAETYGIDATGANHSPAKKRQAAKHSVDKDAFTPIMPIPDSAPDFPERYRAVPRWCYRNADGGELCYAFRLDRPDGGKEFAPLCYCADATGNRQWRKMAPIAPRPLYGLDRLAKAAPDAPILLVEGEKTADAAHELFPEYVCMTWMGGSNATGKADFSPLAGRNVIIWPDNDAPGMKAAKAIMAILPTAKAVTLPDGLPEKWDLADPVPAAMDPRRLVAEATTKTTRETGDNYDNGHRIKVKDAATWIYEPIPVSDPIIEGVFDVGDKCFLIGGSKGRKSFFTMQAALSIAAGKNFLGMYVPKARRVAIAQFEIREHHYQRRLYRMSTAMWIDPREFPGGLNVLNLRGKPATLETLGDRLGPVAPELLIIDPWYKLYGQGHDENSAGDAAALLAKVDRLAEELGAAIWICHHDTKMGSELKATARGAGSGLLARDYDACLLLTPHATESDAVVMSAVLRNYPPQPEMVIRWSDNRFIESPEILPMPETHVTRRAKTQRGPSEDEIIKAIGGWFNGSPLGSLSLQARIRDTFGVGEKRAERIVARMVGSGDYARRRNQETRHFEIIVNPTSATSAPPQNADIAECGVAPTSAHRTLINKRCGVAEVTEHSSATLFSLHENQKTEELSSQTFQSDYE
jgi:hypothetical protein